jgi:hypothetical protein
MLSPRWLIGIVLFLVIAFLLSNWIDGTAMFSNDQSILVTNMTEHNVVSITTASGSPINYINIATKALTAIGKALSWDYSFFYDIDPLTGANANTDLAMILFVIRMCFMAITVGIIFQMAYLLRQIVTG